MKIRFMKLFFAVFLILTISYSCKKKDECSDRVSQPLNEVVVKSIPYQDRQIVVFNTNKQGTISTVVERKFLIIRPTRPMVCEEYLEVNLKRSVTNTNLISFLVRGSSSADSVVQFDITPYGDFYNIIQFVTHENGIMNSFLFNGKSIFHDTYTFNNISYNKVLELYWENQADVRYINRLYYNTEFGILQYETKDGLIGNLVRTK
jgi:hypothetical protein